MCLRDTGASIIFFSRNLILPNQFSTSFEDVHLANGCTVKCPTAIIDIDSPWLTGTVKAIVMDKPIAPLIIGNIPDVVPYNDDEIFRQWLNKKQSSQLPLNQEDKMVIGALETEQQATTSTSNDENLFQTIT